MLLGCLMLLVFSFLVIIAAVLAVAEPVAGVIGFVLFVALVVAGWRAVRAGLSG
jgi:hypothetical protein